MEKTLASYLAADGDAMTRLHLFLTSLFQGHLTDLNPLLRMSLFSSLGPKEKPIALARLKRVTAGMSELIARGMSDGSIRPMDMDALEHLICGAIFGATRQRMAAFGMEADLEPSMISGPLYFQPLFFGLSAPK